MTYTNGLNTCNSLTLLCHLSGWALVEYILFCLVVWWISYLLLFVFSRQSEEWTCRILTLFHGSIVSYSAIRDITACWNETSFQDTPLSDIQKGYLSFMLSYFLFDIAWMQLYGNETWVMSAHHISAILITTKVFLSDFGGLGVSFSVACLELTNPFLQMRWFLRTHGYQSRPIFTVVETIFFCLFFIIRVFGGSIFYYYVIFHAHVDFIMKILATCIYLVSLGLVYDCYKYVRRKYFSNGRHVSFVPVDMWRSRVETVRVETSESPEEE
ncbi:hypothetical protein RUM44_001279 [Polyplax serrata]|uniref:TLC domain-containing protein n=1 Tax=Polyplax serrata TaxID=468196 RepID=A0ABR1AKA8_POLSC